MRAIFIFCCGRLILFFSSGFSLIAFAFLSLSLYICWCCVGLYDTSYFVTRKEKFKTRENIKCVIINNNNGNVTYFLLQILEKRKIMRYYSNQQKGFSYYLFCVCFFFCCKKIFRISFLKDNLTTEENK